jgi:hypothetical protein
MAENGPSRKGPSGEKDAPDARSPHCRINTLLPQRMTTALRGNHSHKPSHPVSSFPQISTAQYCDKRPLLRIPKSAFLNSMRNVSLTAFPTGQLRMSPRSSVKYLCRNILRASPCGSRFCRHPPGGIHTISSGINILVPHQRKDRLRRTDQNPVKSLFRNILRVSPYSSRFCGSISLSHSTNLNEVRILALGREKKVGPPRHAKCMNRPGTSERTEVE